MTAIATQQPTPLDVFKAAGIASSKYNDADFDKMATASGYLPRLTQYTNQSTLVRKKELVIGFYFVTGKDDRAFLGEDVDVVPLAWRFKALDTSAGKPVSSLDPESDLFKSIAARSKGTNSHCQAGIEFLMWVPAVAKFATYLMGSKTAIREAAKVKPLVGCAITIKTHTYDNDEHVWEGPKVFEASVPPCSQPGPGALVEVVGKFLDEVDGVAEEVVEEVKQVEGKGGKRAR